MRASVLPIVWGFLVLGLTGCVGTITPTLTRPELPPSAARSPLKIALIIPSHSKSLTAMDHPPCIWGVAPAPYGELFATLAQKAFSRAFADVAVYDIPEAADAAPHDAVVTLDLTEVEWMLACALDNFNKSLNARGKAVLLSADGQEIWGSAIEVGSAPTPIVYRADKGKIGEYAATAIARLTSQLAERMVRASRGRAREEHGKPRQAEMAAAPNLQGAAAPPADDLRSDVDEPSYKSSVDRSGDFALLIGISKYRDIPEAEFAERDAKAMKRHLLAMGYPEENIISLIGDHATNTSIAEKLERWLPMNVGANSTVFVYYSGHGAPDPDSKQAYLVPWDGAPGDLTDTAFPLSRFYKDLQKLPAKRVLVALDSCFSGAGGRSVLAKGARPLVTKIDTAVPREGKLIVFAASQADQISGTIEDQGHGAFTYYFLKGLNGEAASDGSAGHVTVGSLYGYLAKRVSAAAHRQEREQNPQLQPHVEANGSIQIR